MSARKAEPALREACDLLFAAGWASVELAAFRDPPVGGMEARLEAIAPGTPRQSLEIARVGDTYTIDRYDGVRRVGPSSEAKGAGALRAALAAQAPPTRRK